MQYLVAKCDVVANEAASLAAPVTVIHRNIQKCKASLVNLAKDVNPRNGKLTIGVYEHGATVDNLARLEDWSARVIKIESLMAKIEGLQMRLNYVDKSQVEFPPLVAFNDASFNLTNSRLDVEPFLSYETLWLNQKREIDVSLMYQDSVFFTASPETQFDQPRGTITRLCLPGSTEIEFWLRLEVWPRGGDNLRNIRMVDFNTGKIYAEAKNFDMKETEQSFNLYWRG